MLNRVKTRRDTNLFGPAAVCNVCGGVCASLHQAGSMCGRKDCPGELIHRKFWHFHECPDCHWHGGGLCSICYGRGFTAIPREDITVDALRAYHPDLVFMSGALDVQHAL